VGSTGSDVGLSQPRESAGYEPPTLTLLGGVEELTQVKLKKHGSTDGFTYNQTPITDASA
jgi:hypothetical protein